jgi:hypothetical protein
MFREDFTAAGALPFRTPIIPAERAAPDACSLPLPPDPEPESLKLEKKGITREIQGELRGPEELWAETIAIRLDQGGMMVEATKIRDCSQHFTVRTCKGCGDNQVFSNHCDLFYCPKCAHRIARRRKYQVEWWTKLVSQPKHVVLTVRNSTTLDAPYVRAVKKAFHQLRKSKFARGWRGGCWSLEITNESRGFHVHLHCLIDAQWIDSQQLAKEWAKRVHQDFAIVKVKDVRQADYLREIIKYVAKGSQLARWNSDQVCAFVNSLQAERTFGIFGSLYGQLADWKRAVDSLQLKLATCPCCGGSNFRFLSQSEYDWNSHVCGFA